MMGPVRAKKSLGQHFLHDPGVIRRIIAAIDPLPGQIFAEIGPGTGALTQPLLENITTFDVIEYDNDLAERLSQEQGGERLRVHRADALTFDFKQLRSDTAKIRLVGNLPYNISTPLLFHLLDQADCIEDMTFMLQKEVADRIAAAPDTADYGRLSVMIQYRCGVDILFDVPPGAFRPPPKVYSTVLRLKPQAPKFLAASEERLALFTQRAFAQRRKTLRNALKGLVSETQWLAAQIDPQRRGETLSVEEFVRLVDATSNHCK
jgi:16S rRNA (adenine1518-N6/adenine1519-N6)-dimethyltransferase